MKSKRNFNKHGFNLIFALSLGVLALSYIVPIVINSRACKAVLNFVLPIADHPELGKSIDEILSGRGYIVEVHELTTSDGYIIKLQRMRNPNVTFQNVNPVLLDSAAFGSARPYINDYEGPGYVFANTGLDVWFLNRRGSSCGNRHVSLDMERDAAQFFSFGLIKFAKTDLAEQIDYVLEKSGHNKVSLMTYSVGTSILYALLSKRPEYNEKIAKVAAYGADLSYCNLKSPWRIVLWFFYFFGDLMEMVGLMFVSTDLPICTRLPNVCGTFFSFFQFHNASNRALYFSNPGDGLPLEGVLHKIQSGVPTCDGLPKEFDYDFGFIKTVVMKLGFRQSENMKRYGQLQPPEISAPTVKFSMKSFATVADEFHSVKESRNVHIHAFKLPEEDFHVIVDEEFSHFGFTIGYKQTYVHQFVADYFSGKNRTFSSYGTLDL